MLHIIMGPFTPYSTYTMHCVGDVCGNTYTWKKGYVFNDFYYFRFYNVDYRSESYHMSLVTRKSVYEVSDQLRLKPACSATDTS